MTPEQPDILTRPSRAPDDTIRYAPGSENIIDLYRPHLADVGDDPGARTKPGAGTGPDADTPLVVLIHGGFWRARYDRRHCRPLAAAVADHGYAVALPEYRRVEGGGEWPVIGQDVELALTAIADHVSARPVMLVGHSAGGHLALWAGLRAGPARIRRILALAPVSDLYATAADRLGNGAAQQLLGGEPAEVPTRYADADPWRQHPGDVPVTIIQGDRDESVPVALNRRTAAAHPDIQYVELPDVDHMSLVDPREHACQSAVIPAIIAS